MLGSSWQVLEHLLVWDEPLALLARDVDRDAERLVEAHSRLDRLLGVGALRVRDGVEDRRLQLRPGAVVEELRVALVLVPRDELLDDLARYLGSLVPVRLPKADRGHEGVPSGGAGRVGEVNDDDVLPDCAEVRAQEAVDLALRVRDDCGLVLGHDADDQWEQVPARLSCAGVPEEGHVGVERHEHRAAVGARRPQPRRVVAPAEGPGDRIERLRHAARLLLGEPDRAALRHEACVGGKLAGRLLDCGRRVERAHHLGPVLDEPRRAVDVGVDAAVDCGWARGEDLALPVDHAREAEVGSGRDGEERDCEAGEGSHGRGREVGVGRGQGGPCLPPVEQVAARDVLDYVAGCPLGPEAVCAGPGEGDGADEDEGGRDPGVQRGDEQHGGHRQRPRDAPVAGTASAAAGRDADRAGGGSPDRLDDPPREGARRAPCDRDPGQQARRARHLVALRVGEGLLGGLGVPQDDVVVLLRLHDVEPLPDDSAVSLGHRHDAAADPLHGDRARRGGGLRYQVALAGGECRCQAVGGPAGFGQAVVVLRVAKENGVVLRPVRRVDDRPVREARHGDHGALQRDRSVPSPEEEGDLEHASSRLGCRARPPIPARSPSGPRLPHAR